MKSTQFFFSLCINNLECSEYTHRRFGFFFFPSCFLQHFVRSPVLCHFDPKRRLCTYMWHTDVWIHVPDSVIHASYADSTLESKLSYNLRLSFWEPWSLTSSEHKNDLKGSPRQHIPMWMALWSACQWSRDVQQMCVQSVFFLLTVRDEAIYLSHCE